MLSLVNLAGLSTTVLDFTDDLSPLLLGLICLIWFSAGIIAWWAILDYWPKKSGFAPRAAPTAAEHQEAA